LVSLDVRRDVLVNSGPWPPPPRPGRGRRSGWSIFGIILAVVLGVAGLVVVGLFVFAFVAMSSYGANK
jgi:hypothetical protein